jgi:glycosyltransferase involved in cell wall biosynthesis
MVTSRVIVPGVNLQVFRPASRQAARLVLGVPSDVALLVFVANQGRNNPFKDYATIRRAIALLSAMAPDQVVHVHCIGASGPDEAIGRILVQHRPYVASQQELARHYQAADAYLHAAKAEAFGLVIVEAMACGTPVVATRVGGIPEVLVDGEHGLLVPPEDPDQMAAALASLLGSPTLRQRLGEQAAAHVRSWHDQEAMIDAYLDWFSTCLEEHASPIGHDATTQRQTPACVAE